MAYRVACVSLPCVNLTSSPLPSGPNWGRRIHFHVLSSRPSLASKAKLRQAYSHPCVKLTSPPLPPRPNCGRRIHFHVLSSRPLPCLQGQTAAGVIWVVSSPLHQYQCSKFHLSLWTCQLYVFYIIGFSRGLPLLVIQISFLYLKNWARYMAFALSKKCREVPLPAISSAVPGQS